MLKVSKGGDEGRKERGGNRAAYLFLDGWKREGWKEGRREGEGIWFFWLSCQWKGECVVAVVLRVVSIGYVKVGSNAVE